MGHPAGPLHVMDLSQVLAMGLAGPLHHQGTGRPRGLDL